MNNFYHIENNENSSAKVRFVFRYGFYNENNTQFGLVHLLEHYIAKQINTMYPEVDLFVSVDDKTINFEVTSSNENIVIDTQKIIDFISNHFEHNDNLIEIEKQRIISEYYEKYSEFANSLKDEIKSVVLGSDILKRKNIDQLKNLQNFSTKELEILANKIFKETEIICFALCNKEVAQTIKNIFEKMPCAKVLNTPINCEPETIKVINEIIIKNNCVPPLFNYLVLAFNGNKLNTPLKEKYALAFLLQQIQKKLEFAIEDLGAYRLVYKNISSVYYGLCYFYLQLPKANNQKFINLFYSSLNNLDNEPNKFKVNEISDLKNNWESQLDKFNWTIDDIVDFGRIIPLEEIIEEVEKIDSQSIQNALNIFNKQNSSVIIIEA